MITPANDANRHEKESTDGPKALVLLQEIKAGHLAPKSISQADRRVLVSLLMTEGQSTADMAHLLAVSDKTIERDKKALREKNAISKDPKFVEQIVGRLVSEADTCAQRIRKASRERDATVTDKIEGERCCFQILDALAERLQSLGWLPTATRKLEAELVDHANQRIPTLAEIQHESRRLGQIHNQYLAVPSGQVPENIAEFENDVITPETEEGNHASDDGSA